jgi:hypothetical protein
LLGAALRELLFAFGLGDIATARENPELYSPILPAGRTHIMLQIDTGMICAIRRE